MQVPKLSIVGRPWTRHAAGVSGASRALPLLCEHLYIAHPLPASFFPLRTGSNNALLPGSRGPREGLRVKSLGSLPAAVPVTHMPAVSSQLARGLCWFGRFHPASWETPELWGAWHGRSRWLWSPRSSDPGQQASEPWGRPKPLLRFLPILSVGSLWLWVWLWLS